MAAAKRDAAPASSLAAIVRRFGGFPHEALREKGEGLGGGRLARPSSEPDPLFTSLLLTWARLDSNQGPTDYESAALTS
jgi:hypothetical protein